MSHPVPREHEHRTPIPNPGLWGLVLAVVLAASAVAALTGPAPVSLAVGGLAAPVLGGSAVLAARGESPDNDDAAGRA